MFLFLNFCTNDAKIQMCGIYSLSTEKKTSNLIAWKLEIPKFKVLHWTQVTNFGLALLQKDLQLQ